MKDSNYFLYDHYNFSDEIYDDVCRELTHVKSSASLKSLYFFSSIYEYLIHKGVDSGDILWGVEGSKEFYSGGYKYDFTVKSINLIIEFNGSHVHPDPRIRGTNEWEGWRHYYNRRSSDYIYYKHDLPKEIYAKSIGYKYYSVFDYDICGRVTSDIVSEIDLLLRTNSHCEKFNKYIQKFYDENTCISNFSGDKYLFFIMNESTDTNLNSIINNCDINTINEELIFYIDLFYKSPFDKIFYERLTKLMLQRIRVKRNIND